ncbi:MAG: SixA phosphatase family protein [Rhodospirillales bacterium]|jgi:phosphohistidine phosphatase SixA
MEKGAPQMRLYLITHHQAVPREDVEDMSKRPLSDKGRQDAKNLAKFLKANGENVDRVLHVETSWTRENAELLASELGGVKAEATAYPLQADDDIAPFIDEVKGCSDNVALTGPSNICFKSIAQLLTGRQEPYITDLANGVCACLERGDDGSWSMQWMNRPEQL